MFNTEEVATTIGATIRDRRKKLGLSQTELADLSGVSVRALSNVEGGKPTSRIDIVLTLLDVLGLDITIAIRRPSFERR